MHRYEQVDRPSKKAATFTLGTNGGRDRGEVTGPTKLTLGQQMIVCTPNFAVSPLSLDRRTDGQSRYKNGSK